MAAVAQLWHIALQSRQTEGVGAIRSPGTWVCADGQTPQKHPVRQAAPISARWNSEEQLLVWREAWATAANRCLEIAGHVERIGHHSHAARRLEERPTSHEGAAAQALERRGVISDRVDFSGSKVLWAVCVQENLFIFSA